MRTIFSYLTAIATVAFLAAVAISPANADECTTNTPLSFSTADSPNGIFGGGPGSGSILDQMTSGDLVADLHGTANCPGYGAALDAVNERIDQSQAVSAALSTPVWLEPQEKFAVSGGLGFTDGATAVGATGIVRMDKNWSAFGGGAVSADGDEYAGKAGLRAGF